MTAADRPLTSDTLRRLTTDPGAWLSCDDCFRLVDRYVEGLVRGGTEPSDPELAAMPAHLAGCAACSEEAATMLLLTAEDEGVDAATALRRLPPA